MPKRTHLQPKRFLVAERSAAHMFPTHQSCGMEPGETIAETIVREVREKTGIEATVEKLLGVYSNPRHVSVYDDGEVRRQFSVCFLCRAVGGEPRTSKEPRRPIRRPLLRMTTTRGLQPALAEVAPSEASMNQRSALLSN